MPDRERKRVPEHRSDVPKGRISPPGPSCQSWEHGRCEYPRLREKSEKESRDEATHRGAVPKKNVEAEKKKKKGKKLRQSMLLL